MSGAGATEMEEDACCSDTAAALASYLQGSVAKTLAEGIAATIKAQPEGTSW